MGFSCFQARKNTVQKSVVISLQTKIRDNIVIVKGNCNQYMKQLKSKWKCMFYCLQRYGVLTYFGFATDEIKTQ